MAVLIGARPSLRAAGFLLDEGPVTQPKVPAGLGLVEMLQERRAGIGQVLAAELALVVVVGGLDALLLGELGGVGHGSP